MKRLSIFLFSVLFFSCVLKGADITALDGTVYKNADVLSTMPDGILINFAGKDGFNTVKLVKFNELPAPIQKKYGYNSKKAANYEKEHQQWLNKQQAQAVEKAKIEKEKMEELAKSRQQEKLITEDKTADNASTTQQHKKELSGLADSLKKISNSRGGGGDDGAGDEQQQADNAAATKKLQSSKLKGLLSKLDNMPGGGGELGELMKGEVSSTKTQIKEINKLTK